MKFYQLKKEQTLNISIDKAWEFFSAPENLNEITPPDLDFKIVSDSSPKMYCGQIIEYKIKILPFVKQTWITEIKHVEQKKSFVDEQRFGPYKFWFHKHEFIDLGEKVKILDNVTYSIPFGILGRIVHSLFIKKKLEKIFNFRVKKLNQLFNN